MSMGSNGDDEVVVLPGTVVQDTYGSDHYKPILISGSSPFEITFDAASANPGDVDILENWAGAKVHLHSTLSASFRGKDLVIRMLETEATSGKTIDHYLYIKDYFPSLHRIELIAWDGPASKPYSPTAGPSMGAVGDNADNLLFVTYEVSEFGSVAFEAAHGLNGDDTIIATEGANKLYGGNGNDLYRLDRHKAFPTSDTATIVDTGGENDRLRINGVGVGPDTQGLDQQTLLQLSGIYGNASGLEYLEADDDSGVRWGWDRYEPGVIGLVSGVKETTGTGTFYGTDGADILFGGIAADGAARDIDAGVGNDRVLGSKAAEHLSGGSGDDHLLGNGGDDMLDGGDGDDVLVGGTGNDTFNGGAGADTADYGEARDSVRADLSAGRGAGGDALGDTYHAVENVDGSIFDDILIGDGQQNALSGGNGNDVLIGGALCDNLNGGAGFDIVSYSNSDAGVHIYLHSGHGAVSHAEGDVYGSIEGANGSNYDDIIFGNDTDNTIKGLNGDDLLIGSGGSDRLDGGAGVDTVSYSRMDAAVAVRLDLRNGTKGNGEKDVYTSIESATGSEFSDVIYGDRGNNTLKGLGGNDHLIGGQGDDLLIGGNGHDTLAGGMGADIIDGGAGINTASYENAADDIRVDLRLGRGFSGEAAGDTLIGISGLIGSAHKDMLAGSRLDETLNGGAGDDRLAGRGGNDLLIGGPGRDAFVYSAGSDSGTGPQDRDTIVDFSRSEGDVIDLATLDANAGLAGDQAFHFIGTTAFTAEAGQMRYTATPLYRVVEMDLDGDGIADMQIRVNGSGALLASDFVL